MLYISLLLALLAVACLIFVPNTVILLSFVAIMHGFAVYSACHALLHKRDSRAALGWIAIILFMPPVGLPLYWLFGIARIDSQAVRLMEKAAQKVMGGLVDLHGKSLTEKPEGFIDKDEVPHAWHYLVNPGSSITGRCMLEGNDLTVLHNGEAAYPVMLKAISEAKERVFLSSFIFGYDEVGKSFAAALRAAAERGCDVRLLMDGVGSFHLWPSWRKRLGPDVKLAYFLPPRLIPPQFSINLRTHRKVLICDSETGFTGGMNISQNHLANLKRRSRVQDVHFRCLGPIAQQLEIAFLMDWSFATGDHTNFTVHPVKKQGSSLCRILMDGPGTPEDTILDLVCAQISAARHSVRIMSPYFLPPHRLHGELVSAVLRGVDVSVILPGENNHRMNISQNHLANLKRRSRVQDVHFRCLGPIAQQLEIAFLMDWSFATGDHTNFTVHPVKKQGSSLCRILMDGPGTPEDTILDLVCAQISAARHSVRIMSPYFLPPHRLHGELVSAVLRGVDVSVILPGENNHRLVDWAMRHQMPMLADRGVKIYRQPPPFAHTKLLLIDGEYTLLGSANLDPRSLNLNFELVMEVLDLRLAEQLSAFYDEVRSRSVSVPTTYPALPYRLRNAASWIFSPYL